MKSLQVQPRCHKKQQRYAESGQQHTGRRQRNVHTFEQTPQDESDFEDEFEKLTFGAINIEFDDEEGRRAFNAIHVAETIEVNIDSVSHSEVYADNKFQLYEKVNYLRKKVDTGAQVTFCPFGYSKSFFQTR